MSQHTYAKIIGTPQVILYCYKPSTFLWNDGMHVTSALQFFRLEPAFFLSSKTTMFSLVEVLLHFILVGLNPSLNTSITIERQRSFIHDLNPLTIANHPKMMGKPKKSTDFSGFKILNYEALPFLVANHLPFISISSESNGASGAALCQAGEWQLVPAAVALGGGTGFGAGCRAGSLHQIRAWAWAAWVGKGDGDRHRNGKMKDLGHIMLIIHNDNIVYYNPTINMGYHGQNKSTIIRKKPS